MSIIITLFTINFSCFLFLGCDIDKGTSDPATAAAAWSLSNGYLPNPCSLACARTIGCEESSCTPNGECAGLYVASGLELCYGDTADDCPANAEPLPCASGGDVRDPDAIEETEEGVLVESTQSVVDDTVPVDEPKIKNTEITETKEETVGEAGKEAEAKPKSVVQDEEAEPTETSQSGEELKPQEVADPEEQAEWRRGGETEPEAKPESGETEPEAKPESGETEPEARPEERAEKEVEVQVNPKEVEVEGEAEPKKPIKAEEGTESREDAKPEEGTESGEDAKPEEGTESREDAKPEEGTESREDAKPEEGTESREDKPTQQSTRFGRVEAMSKAATTEVPTKEPRTPTPEQSEAEPEYRAKDPESEEVVPEEIGSAEEGGSIQEQSKMPGSQEEVPSEHWLARSPELAEGKELPAGEPSSHQEAAVAESEPTEGGLGQAMSPESEEVFGGGTYTQEKPSCPYLRGEGYTAPPTFEGEKAVATVATEATEGMATGVTEAKASTTTEGKATGVTEAKASKTTEGKATGVTEAKATGVTEAKATGVTEAKTTGVTEAKATGDTEAKATGDTEAKAIGVTEAKATGVTEAKATGVTEAKASKTTEGKASKTTKGKASEPTEGKVTEASEAGATETSKSGETGILLEVGGTGGPTSAKGWSTTPGSTSTSPRREGLPCEHEGLATGIGSHGGERVEASRRPPAADTTTLPTGPITSRPAEEVPYKLVYEPPVLHHGDEPATSWTDEQVATHGRAEASTEKPSDSQPFKDPVRSGSGER
ncbi:hypothetical protein FOZ62_020558, partial [Perkinsus olseni]